MARERRESMFSMQDLQKVTLEDDKFEALTYDPLNLFYSEYRYLLGGVNGTLDAFTSFQLKVVMKTTNTCEIPVIGSIRAIALI